MKKALVFLLFLSFSVKAQDTKEKKKTEEDPLKKVEAEFNKAFDGLFKTKKKETTDPKPDQQKPKSDSKEVNNSTDTFGGFSFGGKPKESYSFGSSMTMKMTQKNPKDKQSFTMRNKYMFSDDMSAMAIKFIGSDNPDMAKASSAMDAMVMDFEQKKMFTFMNNEGKKTLMAIGFKADEMEKYVEKENQNIKITKTAQTKTKQTKTKRTQKQNTQKQTQKQKQHKQKQHAHKNDTHKNDTRKNNTHAKTTQTKTKQTKTKCTQKQHTHKNNTH